MSSSSGTTSIPALTITSAGVVAPDELDVLTGALTDISAAMGGNVNQDLSTPQGQIATSEAAAIGNCYDAILAVANGVDPKVASGRMQDAIGNIYFMTRVPATATTVAVSIVGTAGQVVASGSVIATDGVYQYALTADVTIPAGGTASATVANTETGALACSANSLSLYQYTAGVSSVSNASPGVLGSDAEGRIAFEERRNNSVSANSTSQTASILGQVLKLSSVTDAYAYSNGTTAAVTYNGVSVPANSVYCCVAGGAPADIGLAIMQKKSPGCGTTGGTSVQVQDPAAVYNGNGPTYTINYAVAQATPVYLAVTIKNGVDVPSDALTQIQNAVLAQFASGGSSGLRPTIASTIYASQFGCAIMSLGTWARLVTLQIGTAPPANQNLVTMTMAQVPTMAAGNISLTLV
ncbi:baseplate J/gp47 family protein [Asaia sp. HN128]|uniref:baseplate J/gp47 family protein n=1 Tax=Asaia sp. HN128 TaxID=3081234 RepID=UPI00301ADDEC